MRIKKLILENFRCYKETTYITFEKLTALIGKNDAGKSTILEALDIFFNEGSGATKIDKQDCNVNSNSNEFLIGVIFDNLPERIIVDSTVETSLNQEYLVNKDRDLQVVKRFKNGKLDSINLICDYPESEILPNLHSTTVGDLRKLAAMHKIEVADARKASLLRKAIFDYNKPFNTREKEINIKQEGGKQIWESLQKYLPIYSLFQSDRKNDDKDTEVQDPMKAAIKEILKEEGIADILDSVFKKVEKAANDVASLTIEKLSEMNPEIASELKSEFEKPKWDAIFKCGLQSDLNIPLNKRGSGVRRLVLLNFFRAKVDIDRNTKGLNNVIYAFEEPETALHPDHQKMLIESFLELSKNENTQIIFTTHSPEIAKMTPIKSLRLIKKECVGTQIIEPNPDIIKEIVNTLGVFPTIQLQNIDSVKVAICVEGKNDIDFLTRINEVIPEFKETVDLKSNEIIILPLGGSTLKFWVNNEYLGKLNLAQVHIYDSDIGSQQPHKYKEYVDKINMQSKCNAFETSHREMENYITPNVLKRIIDFDINDIDSENWSSFSVPEAYARYKHKISESTKRWDELDDDKKKKKISQAKNTVNTELVKKVKKKDLIEYNLYDEVLSWFRAIKQFL